MSSECMCLHSHPPRSCRQYVTTRSPNPTAKLDIEPKEFSLSKDVEVVESFDAMGLHPDLLRGIFAYGALCPRFRVPQ